MKAIGLAAGVLVFILGAVSPEVTLADTLDEVRSLMRQGRHDDAIRRLDSHLSSSPDDTTARFLKGVALAESGRRRQAIDTFSALARDFPDLPEPHNNLAVLHAASGDLEKARAYLLEAIRIHPSYATAHENLGDVYGKLAALSYSRAVALDEANRSARAKYALTEELGDVGGGSRATALTAPAPAPPTTVTAAAAPALPAMEPAAPADVEAEILNTVRSWSNAWSDQDVSEYLAHYARAFVPADGRSRENWTILRRKRVSGPQFIDVKIAEPRVTQTGDGRASVTFEQFYRSDRYADQVIKRLDFVRERGTWKILLEQTVN